MPPISPRGFASTSADYGGFLCFLVSALALAPALASPLSASPFRGVSPRDEKYFMGPVIACRDGSATFPKDRINDGFCDCPDGTDEPDMDAYSSKSIGRLVMREQVEFELDRDGRVMLNTRTKV